MGVLVLDIIAVATFPDATQKSSMDSGGFVTCAHVGTKFRFFEALE
jgi:hypothetical protein